MSEKPGIFFFDYNYMTYVFRIDSETPSKKNSRVVLPNGKNIPSKNFRLWHECAFVQVKTQMVKQSFPAPIETPVKIKLQFTHGDLRRRDSDNGTSSIMDLLTDCGVLKDDCWQIVRQIEVLNGYEKNKAECAILIETL